MRLGLRVKSALALCACLAAVFAMAGFAGWRALDSIEEKLGAAFARNATQLNKQRILAPVSRELALSQRLADSQVTRRWLLDENNADKKALFFAEAEGYRRAFADHSYFVISRASRDYYFNDARGKFSTRARYALKEKSASDAWFFSTMKNTQDFNLNVDLDAKLKLTKVWFNVLVKENGRNIGLAGTGLDLTTFLDRFIKSAETGSTPILLNRDGAIQAHPDRTLIDYASVNDKGAQHSTLFRLLPPGEEPAVRAALNSAAAKPDTLPVFWAEMNGKRQLFAVSFIPELKWFVLTAVDLKAARVIDTRLWTPLALGASILLAILMLAILVAVDRLLLAPLLGLTRAVRSVGAGNYALELPRAGGDELGELTRAFGTMATQVRTHTDELEGRVRERTQELVQVNEQMSVAAKQIGDSIQYARLIQNSILPDAELRRTLREDFFVLWRPRDVVGGDFYLFRADENGFLAGVVDCAGHGVPGAFMTMMAHTVLNVAADEVGLRDPAQLLSDADARLRVMLASSQQAHVSTQMDAALAYFDCRAHNVTFSGAKLSLYWCDGQTTGELKGERGALGDKRATQFSNQELQLARGTNFYFSTDGLLDQAGGGKGFGLGNERFADLLKRLAPLPFAQQREILAQELAHYQGALPQRDDIAVLGLKIPC